MFLWTIQSIIISIVLIFLVHHLIYFFKSTLTVPKIKDLVNDPKHKYHAIYQTISGSGSGSVYTSNSSTNIDSSIKSELSLMKNDLKNFLKEQMDLKSTTDISSFDLLPTDEIINTTDILPTEAEYYPVNEIY
jgi:vacuolar-type H+-ATPase catalytic subunit A/Vma1